MKKNTRSNLIKRHLCLLLLMLLLNFLALGSDLPDSLLMAKSLVQNRQKTDAAVYIKKAQASHDPRIKNMADFWNDFNEAKILIPDMLEARLQQRIRKGLKQADRTINHSRQLVSVFPFSSAAHLSLSQAYLWYGTRFSSAENMIQLSTGTPYAALHEAQLADALARTWAQKYRAKQFQVQARSALVLQGLSSGELQGWKIRELRKEMSEILRRMSVEEARKTEYFYPMEPLLKMESFLILAPVAE